MSLYLTLKSYRCDMTDSKLRNQLLLRSNKCPVLSIRCELKLFSCINLTPRKIKNKMKSNPAGVRACFKDSLVEMFNWQNSYSSIATA